MNFRGRRNDANLIALRRGEEGRGLEVGLEISEMAENSVVPTSQWRYSKIHITLYVPSGVNYCAATRRQAQ